MYIASHAAWVHENVRPEHLDLKKANIPTYSEVVDSMSDFKKAQRLIKSRIINEQYVAQSAQQTQQSFAKKTERDFPIKHDQYQYPQPGLNVGPLIYRTNNMNYGTGWLSGRLRAPHGIGNSFEVLAVRQHLH